MPTLLIDMPAGIAGDMLLAALAAVGGDLARVEHDLLALGIGPIRIRATAVSVSGITATQVDVEAEQEPRWQQPAAAPGQWAIAPAAAASAVAAADAHAHHPHRPYRLIRDLVAAAALPERVKARAQRVFRALAEAEGAVHGVAADEVEFHEVGALDAIADVVGCCLLLEQLGIDRIVAGPVLPGEGSVRCAHGRMPVPVPAVAAMLASHRAPQRRLARETGELTTPTGCALVVALTDAWLDDVGAAHVATRVGHGAGHKRFPDLANVLRVSLVEDAGAGDRVFELRCQVDDATGEQLAALIDDLLAAGARDAYLTPIIMKKGRPGHELTVLGDESQRTALADLVLTRSSTIGVRWSIVPRRILPRRAEQVVVDGHTIALKIVTLPDGSERAKPEADDVAAAARVLQRGFADVQAAALAAWRSRR